MEDEYKHLWGNYITRTIIAHIPRIEYPSAIGLLLETETSWSRRGSYRPLAGHRGQLSLTAGLAPLRPSQRA